MSLELKVELEDRKSWFSNDEGKTFIFLRAGKNMLIDINKTSNNVIDNAI